MASHRCSAGRGRPLTVCDLAARDEKRKVFEAAAPFFAGLATTYSPMS